MAVVARKRKGAVYGTNVGNLVAPVAKPRTLPQTAGGAFTPTAGGTAPDPAPTADATYIAQAAKRAFERQQRLQQLNLEDQQDVSDSGEQRRRFDEEVPKTQQSAKQNAARAGLFYSGTLGKQLGEINTKAERSRGDMARDLARRQAARLAARQAIEQGAPIEDAAAWAENIDRQIDRDSQTAELGALAPMPAENPVAPRLKPSLQRTKEKKTKKYNWGDGKGRVHSRPKR